MIIRELITTLGFKLDKKPIEEYERAVDRIPNKLNEVQAKIRNVVGAIAGAWGLHEFIKAGDEAIAQMARLQYATQGTAQTAQAVYERLYAIGRMTGVSLEASVDAFAGFRAAIPLTRATSDEVANLVQGLQQAGIVAGTSTQSIQAAMTQITQGFNLGRFETEETKSILENMGPFANALARALYPNLELDAAKARMIQDAGNSQLTLARMLPAMLTASGQMGDAFARIPVTANRGWSILGVTFRRLMSDFNMAYDISNRIGRALVWASNLLDDVRQLIPQFKAFINENRYLVNILQSIGVTAALAFGPRFLTMMGLATGATIRFGWAFLRAAAGPALIAAGLALVGLALADVYGYFNGQDSLTAILMRDFGDTQFGQGFIETLTAVRDLLTATRDIAVDMWPRIKAAAQEVLTWLRETFGAWFPDMSASLENLGGDWERWAGRAVAAIGLVLGSLWVARGVLGMISGILRGLGIGAAAGAAATAATGAATGAAGGVAAGAVGGAATTAAGQGWWGRLLGSGAVHGLFQRVLGPAALGLGLGSLLTSAEDPEQRARNRQNYATAGARRIEGYDEAEGGSGARQEPWWAGVGRWYDGLGRGSSAMPWLTSPMMPTGGDFNVNNDVRVQVDITGMTSDQAVEEIRRAVESGTGQAVLEGNALARDIMRGYGRTEAGQ